MAKDREATGWGYSIWRNKVEIAYGFGRPGLGEVFDAEVVGARMGLAHAISLPNTTEITACVDNQAVIWCLIRNPSTTSFDAFQKWHNIADEHSAQVDVRWCPGHEKIEGNERADKMANKGLKEQESSSSMTLARVRRYARAASRGQFEAWFNYTCPRRYHSLFGEEEDTQPQAGHQQKVPFEAAFKCPEGLKLPRYVLARWIALRTGHGDFKEYHERFRHHDAELACSCGRPKTPEHLVYCSKTRRIKSAWPKSKVRTPDEWFMQLVLDHKMFKEVATKTRFFAKICPWNIDRAAWCSLPTDSILGGKE